MKAGVAGTILLVSLTGMASAELRYDRKLEAAVLARVAGTIGDIRPSFGLKDKVEYVRGPDEPVMAASSSDAAAPQEPVGTLSPAVDGKALNEAF